MEPEKEFLENAASMVIFAQKEIKQFLTWTNKKADYRKNAEEVITELSNALVRVKQLQEEYEKSKY